MAGMPKPLTPEESEAGWQSVYLEQQRAAQAAAAPTVPAPVIAKQAGFPVAGAVAPVLTPAKPTPTSPYMAGPIGRLDAAGAQLDASAAALNARNGLGGSTSAVPYVAPLPSPAEWIRNLIAEAVPSRVAGAAPPMPPSTPGMAALQRGAVIPPELRKPVPTFFENAVNFFRGAPPIGSTASPRRDGGVRS